jgi:hypothetical protein
VSRLVPSFLHNPSVCSRFDSYATHYPPPTTHFPRPFPFLFINLPPLCHSQKSQLLCNQANPASFSKMPGVWGGASRTQLRDTRVWGIPTPPLRRLRTLRASALSFLSLQGAFRLCVSVSLWQIPSFQCLGASCFLLPLFFALVPFVFSSFQPLFPKTPGVGYPLCNLCPDLSALCVALLAVLPGGMNMGRYENHK